jgi:hypothetical protein
MASVAGLQQKTEKPRASKIGIPKIGKLEKIYW